MTQPNDDPLNQSNPRRSLFGRVLGKGVMAATAAKANLARPVQEKLGPGSMKRVAASLPKAPTYGEKAYMNHNLLEISDEKGHRGITGIAIIGDTAIAVVRESSEQQGSARTLIKLVELPFGEHAGLNQQTGKVLKVIDPEVLKKRRDGVIKQWETVTLGRSSAGTDVVSVSTDPEVSRHHASITVTSEGLVELTDTSTNGTAVINNATVFGPAARVNPELIGLFDQLQANPIAWDTDASRHAIIVHPG